MLPIKNDKRHWTEREPQGKPQGSAFNFTGIAEPREVKSSNRFQMKALDLFIYLRQGN